MSTKLNTVKLHRVLKTKPEKVSQAQGWVTVD